MIMRRLGWCYEGAMYRWDVFSARSAVRLRIDRQAVRDRVSSHYPQLSSIDRFVTRTHSGAVMARRSPRWNSRSVV